MLKYIEKSVNLKANSKSNEIGGFNFEGGRIYIVRRALRPNYGSSSSSIPSHEYVTLSLWNVHFFPSHDQNQNITNN